MKKVASVEILFSSTPDGGATIGDLILGQPGTGFVDGNTWISVDGGAWTTFTIEFSGHLAYDPQLIVNGMDLVGEGFAVITVTGCDRLFFFSENPAIDKLTIDSMLSKEFSLDSDGVIVDPLPVCFTKGAVIRCKHGGTLVEQLEIGSMVVTADGSLREIK